MAARTFCPVQEHLQGPSFDLGMIRMLTLELQSYRQFLHETLNECSRLACTKASRAVDS